MARTTKDGRDKHRATIADYTASGRRKRLMFDPDVVEPLLDDADMCEELELLLVTSSAQCDLLRRACDAYEIEIEQANTARHEVEQRATEAEAELGRAIIWYERGRRGE